MRGVLTALLVLTLAAPALGQSPPAHEPPVYSLGETWVRSDGVYRLENIERDAYVFTADGRREVHLTKELAVKKIVRGGIVAVEFDPPSKIKWPLTVGAWGQNWGYAQLDGFAGYKSGVRRMFFWRVDTYEDVKTAAGTFKAFRIRQTIELEPRQANPLTELVLWYAPAIKQIVKSEPGRGLELLAFELTGPTIASAPPVTTPSPNVAVESTPAPTSGLRDIGVVPRTKADSPPPSLGAGPDPRPAGPAPAVVSPGPARPSIAKPPAATTPSPAAVPPPAAVVPPPAAVPAAVPPPPVAVPPPPAAVPPSPKLAPSSSTAAPVEVAPTVPAPSPRPDVATPAPRVTAAPPAAPPAAPAPVRVAISSPPDQSRFEQDSVPMAGLVTSGKGVTRVVVSLNAAEVARLEERTPQPAMSITSLLKLREGPNMLVVAATEADGTINQEIRTLYYDRPVPLTLGFRHPADGIRVSDESIAVAAVVTSGKGVRAVRLLVNGRQVFQESQPTPQKSVVVTAPVTLNAGPNAIVLVATDADGTVRQELRTVYFDRPKVAAVPPPLAVSRESWAVIIGVGKYDSRAIPPLRYSVPDADAMYKVLTESAGFKKDHVLLLSDTSERKPTLRNIKYALGTFLARSAKKDDTVVVFFAGHGAPEVDPRGIERDGLAKYLIPSDADAEDLYSTAFPMDELQNIFGRIEADRVIAFIDACYSGAAGGRTFLAKRTRAGDIDDLFLERLTRSKGRAIITAARPSEVAMELPEFGHGIFTYYLVRGLSGAADLNRDGIVAVQELYEYVEQQVTQKSRSVGGNQHPMMKGELEGPVPLVRVGRP